MAAPLAKNKPVPIAPPMAIMLSCRLPIVRLSSRASPEVMQCPSLDPGVSLVGWAHEGHVAVRTMSIGCSIHDGRGKFLHRGQRAGLRATAFNQPSLCALRSEEH